MKENIFTIPIEGTIEYGFVVTIQDHSGFTEYQFTFSEPTFNMGVQ